LHIQNDVEKSEEKRAALSAQKTVEDLIADMKKSESTAAGLLQFYNRSADYYAENINKIEDLEKRLENADVTDPEFERLSAAVKSLFDTFSKMEGNLSGYAAKIDNTVNRFGVINKKRQDGMTAFKEQRTKYEQLRNARRPETEVLSAALAEAEKKVDGGLLAKYKALRADKKVPPAVPLNEKLCGGCGMDMSLSVLETLKSRGWVECDNCRRIIYK
jgi:predicted  nucleic acid-binding Zn-ribbon protein